MRSQKNVKAHGLPKIFKEILSIPKFRPIIETTGTSHWLQGKYLISLLYPLTINKFSLKDSFVGATRIKATPSYLFKNDYHTYLLMWNDFSSMFPSDELLTQYKDEYIKTV